MSPSLGEVSGTARVSEKPRKRKSRKTHGDSGALGHSRRSRDRRKTPGDSADLTEVAPKALMFIDIR